MIKVRSIYIICFCIIILILQSCKVSNFLAENEKLYLKPQIKFENEKIIADKSGLEEKLETKLYPDYNKKFLGLFYIKVWLYQKVKTKKNKGFKHWLKTKIGKEPILLNDVDINLMEKVLDKTMQDNGYFNTKTTAEIIEKKQTAKIKYTINHDKQKIIDSIIFPKTNTDLDSIFEGYKYLKTKQGKAYNLDNLIGDRNNLASEIRSLGYFDFKVDDIYFVIDTSLADNFLNVYYKVKVPENGTLHKKYYISTINVYHTFESLNPNEEKRTDFIGSFYYKDYAFRGDYKFVGKRALYRNFIVEPGDLFSVKKYEYTSERLTNLDVYDFVNINYFKNKEDSLTVDIN